VYVFIMLCVGFVMVVCVDFLCVAVCICGFSYMWVLSCVVVCM
jgi:hypothetical protein